MKLAVVGWAADSGVGRELVDAARNLPVSCAFILHNPSKPTRADLVSHIPHTLSVEGRRGLDAQMGEFLDRHRPDAVLTWEVPGSWSFPALWASRGVRWVCVVHWDWFNPSQMASWRTARLVSPNRLCQREIKNRYGLESVLLPVPVDTERLKFRERGAAERFVSVYGYGGPAERRSLRELLRAWEALPAPPALVIRAQKWPEEVSPKGGLPRGVSVDLRTTPEPGDLFSDSDVAVQVSRYEGVAVTFMEAQACGAPVIAVDAEPMCDVAPFVLVRPEKVVSAHVGGKTIPSYVPSAAHLAEVVTSLAGRDLSDLSRRARAHAEDHSWSALKGRWIEALSR